MIAGFSLIWKNCCCVKQVLEMEQAKTLLKTTRDTEQRYAAFGLIGKCCVILRSAVWCLQVVTENERSGKTEIATYLTFIHWSPARAFLQKVKRNKVVKGSVCITFQLLRFLFCKLICDRRKNQKGMYSCLAFVVTFVLAVSPLMIPLPISRAWSKVSGKDFSGIIDPLLILILFCVLFHLLQLLAMSVLSLLHSFRQVALFLGAFSWPFPGHCLVDNTLAPVCVLWHKWQILRCTCLTWSLGLQKQYNYILRISYLILACMHLKAVVSFIFW